MRRRWPWVLGLGLGGCLLSMCACGPVTVTFVELLFRVAFGWVSFLWRVLPEVEPNWLALGEAAVVLVLLAGGLHAFLRWLAREREQPPWPLRRSLGLLLAVVLMFGTSIASAGIAHQLVWLQRDGYTERTFYRKADATYVLDQACRRADWSKGPHGLAWMVGEEARTFDIDRFHYVFLSEGGRNLMFVFPREPELQARVGGQKCLEVDLMPNAIPVPPEELAEHIADPWLGTY